MKLEIKKYKEFFENMERMRFEDLGHIKRHLENHLLYMATKYPVVTLTGPRQSGKSTIVRHTFPEKKY